MNTVQKLIVVVAACLLAGTSPGCASPKKPAGILYETSTINALLDGAYDGDVTFAELKKHGNFGLGTFENLDGEMIALDGTFYQVRTDGKASPVPPGMRTPFSAVLFFEPTIFAEVQAKSEATLDYAQLQARVLELLKNRNAPHAIRVDGLFDVVTVRSVPRQSPPYRRLAEVVKTQAVFEHKNVRGTLVGFWCPAYLSTLNVAGFHFHFITDDRTTGGHVLACRTNSGRVSIQEITALYQRFPQNDEFRKANLNPPASDVHAVEQGK